MVALAAMLFAAEATGWTPFEETPERRVERLAPHWRLLTPDGPGPHPAAILLSGCDGVHDNMDFWAAEFVRRGRAALIVDSHGPRGLDRLESWRLVCSALALGGAERAGDVEVALHALAGMDEIRGDVVLFGASHGGWAAMEFVALAGSGAGLPGLTGWPEPPGELLSRISALVLLYPYCGLLNDAGPSQWQAAPPTLMVLAEEDSIVSTPSCLEQAAELRGSGATVVTEVLPGADHGFDQREKSVFSTLDFEPDLRAAAVVIVDRFLDPQAP
jgi:dienelactone hydrolase